MEDWQIDFEWLRTRHELTERLGLEKIPDLNAILVLIGIRELGTFSIEYTKEEKQDLMHVAVCTLLENDYYEFEGMDADGWPHWVPIKRIDVSGEDKQEDLLKRKVISYFRELFFEEENSTVKR